MKLYFKDEKDIVYVVFLSIEYHLGFVFIPET